MDKLERIDGSSHDTTIPQRPTAVPQPPAGHAWPPLASDPGYSGAPLAPRPDGIATGTTARTATGAPLPTQEPER